MKQKVSIRTIISATLLAIALWTYNSLRSEYEVISDFPLEIITHENTSIENTIPSSVSLKIKGTGWQLVNVLYVNPNAKSIVDLSKRTSFQPIDTIISADIKQGFRAPQGVQVVDVLPKEIVTRIGSITQKKVPLIPRVSLAMHEGFIQIGQPMLQTDSVVLQGNAALLNTISAWYTEPLRKQQVKENVSLQLKVSDSLSNILTVTPSTVGYSVQVDRMAETTVYDIPVQIIGAPQQSVHTILPQIISVVVRGGINQIAELTPQDFIAIADYNQLRKDTTGIIKPIITAPENIRILQVIPDVLQHRTIHL